MTPTLAQGSTRVKFVPNSDLSSHPRFRTVFEIGEEKKTLPDYIPRYLKGVLNVYINDNPSNLKSIQLTNIFNETFEIPNTAKTLTLQVVKEYLHPIVNYNTTKTPNSYDVKGPKKNFSIEKKSDGAKELLCRVKLTLFHDRSLDWFTFDIRPLCLP